MKFKMDFETFFEQQDAVLRETFLRYQEAHLLAMEFIEADPQPETMGISKAHTVLSETIMYLVKHMGWQNTVLHALQHSLEKEEDD